MMRRFLTALAFIAPIALLSSCREGYNVPFYVGCVNDCEPFGYTDANGQLAGLEIDIINAIAEDQGIWMEFIPTDQKDILDELKSRRHKMECGIGMIEWTTEREKVYKFVSPAYYKSSLSLATSKNTTGISTISDLRGRTLAVKENSLAHTHACSLADSIGFTVKVYSSYDDAVKAVENGQADAIEEEYPMLQYRIARKNAQIRIVDKGVENMSFAIMTQRDEDKTLRRYLATGLQDIVDNGKMDKIIKKYFPDTDGTAE